MFTIPIGVGILGTITRKCRKICRKRFGRRKTDVLLLGLFQQGTKKLN